MNVRRIEKLIAHLETVPAKGFDMRWWVQKDGVALWTSDASKLRAAHRNRYECGMTACLGGHAAIVFPRLLRFDSGYIQLRRNPDLDSILSFGEALGLCAKHAESLTSPHAPHQTPKRAIRALRALVRENPICCGGTR